jgi:lactoylglutathione lyase
LNYGAILKYNNEGGKSNYFCCKTSRNFSYIYASTNFGMKKIIIVLLPVFISINVAAQQAKARINHTAVYVMDVKTSTAFYQTIIGLDTVPEPFHDGKHAWFKTGPGTSLHIIQGAEAKKEYYKNQHTCYSVPSVDDFTKLLAAKNIPFEDVKGNKNAVTTRIDGIKQLWLQDPDGYWIEINDAKD